MADTFLADELAAYVSAARGGAKSSRQVTARTGTFNQKSGSATRSGWRSWQLAYVPLTSIKVGFWNGFTNGSSGGVAGVETGCGGVMTVALSIEYPRGTFTRITGAGGQSSFTIADNAIGFSDDFALPFTIPAFTWFRICGDFQFLSGGTVPSMGWSNVCDRSMGDEYQVNTTQDYTLNNTVLGGTSLATAVFPQLVLGQSDKGVWGIIGDSIAAGVNDTTFDPSGGRGIVGRALARSGPMLNYGHPGDRAQYYAANSAQRRALMAAGGVTSYILELGVNDVANSRTAANLLADRATIRGLLPAGVPVYDTTLTPQTSSNDGFRSAAGQTISGPGTTFVERKSFNNTLRSSLVAGSAGTIDVTSLVETKPAFAGTASFATNQMTVTGTTSGFPSIGDVITSTGVAAGTYILSGTGPYTLSTSPGTIAAQAVSAPANEIGPVQDGGVWIPQAMAGGDGTHPVPAGLLMIDPLVASLIAMRR